MFRIVIAPFILLISLAAQAQEKPYTYRFFTNSAMSGDHFYSNAKATGNASINNINGKLPVSNKRFHTPGNALELSVTNGTSGQWQAAVNYAEKRGMDHFKKALYVSFFVYVEGNAVPASALPLIRFMKRDSSFTKAASFNVTKPNQWQRVLIPAMLFGAATFSKITDIGSIVFIQQNNDGIAFKMYIDDIELTDKSAATPVSFGPQIVAAKGYSKHIDISWNAPGSAAVNFIKIYRSTDNQDFLPVGMQSGFTNRYADFTGETGRKYWYKISAIDDAYRESALSKSIMAETKPMTDEQMLDMVQEASFRYYWEANEKESGLAKENIPGRHDMIASGASGFGIMALIAGTERKFITRKQSVDRFIKIVNFLDKAETFHGVYPHFINGPTGKVEPFFGKKDNGADLVETSFLLQGLLAARQYFNHNNNEEKLIRDKINVIWQKAEWSWFTQFPGSKFLYWHWSPDQAWVINHNLIGWNETMVTYLLAIASPTHAVPASMYYSGWANQDSTGQKYRSAWGQTKDGSMYSNGNTYFGIRLDVGVSNGGPLFFTHYSYLGYDPHAINDKYTNYFVNNQHIALINYNYCVENPKKNKGYSDSAWGLTASDGPFDYSADEPVPAQDHGKIAPTGAISSFPYTPVESMKALKNYYNNYGKFLWGEYGFRDAFDLSNNWCSEIYMGLNQAPMTVMIENYRTGLIWKLFMSSPEIKEGLKKLDQETIIQKNSNYK